MDKETRKMFNMVIEAMDQMEQRINRRFDKMEKEMATKEELRNVYESLHHEINGVKLNTEALDMRMEYVEKKLDSVDNRLGIVETKVDSLETKVDSLETRMDSFDTRLDSFETRMDSFEVKMDDMHTTLKSMGNHEPRIQALEHVVFGKNKRARRPLWQPLH